MPRWFEGYRVEKELGAPPMWIAVRARDRARVVIKAYAPECADDARAEHEALLALAGAGAPAVLELVCTAPEPFLVMELVPGSTLSAQSPLAVSTFLDMAIPLVGTLASLHDRRLLHNQIHPDHVLLGTNGADPTLVGFGSARPFGTRLRRSARALRFASPEQSGRTNLPIDFRSDIYSLGATFYFALTGQPPFAEPDPLALIHAHIAKVPEAPHVVVPRLPPTLSRIVMKALAKDPESRYQSALALRVDLLECRSQLERFGEIDDALVLGTAETPERPLFSRRLHGRDETLAGIFARFAEARAGASRVLVVRGPAGAGKSALVDALQAEIVGAGGYLARGRYEEPRRAHPYTGLIQALEALAHQALSRDESALARIRGDLQRALGSSAPVLVDLVPDFAPILGQLRRPPRLGPAETAARLALAIDRTVGAFARTAHPLVLVLEDLHWVDALSQAVLERLATPRRDERALLLLGTARDASEADRTVLEGLVSSLGRSRAELETIDLDRLPRDAIEQMLADALCRSVSEVERLATIVERKTGGSPFLVQQFVYLVHARGLVRYENGRWSWDESAIAESEVPDGAVGMMLEKLGSLDGDRRRLLRLASCAGMGFDADLLAALSGGPRGEIGAELFALSQTGIVAPFASGFRFVHDRIREAAQDLCTPEEISATRVDAGLFLLDHLGSDELRGRRLEVADHLAAGICAGPDRLRAERRWRAVEVLAEAADAAFGEWAMESARRYTSAALAILSPHDWARDRALVFRLHLTHVRARRTDRTEATRILDALAARADVSALERSRIVGERVAVRAATDGPIGAVETGIAEAHHLGIHLPRDPSRLRVAIEVAWTGWRLHRGARRIMLRPSVDPPPEVAARLAVYRVLLTHMAYSGSDTYGLAVARTTRLSLRHGPRPGIGRLALSWAFLAAERRAFAKTKRYLELAETWDTAFPNRGIRAATRNVAMGLTTGFTVSAREAVDQGAALLEELQAHGDRSGAQSCVFKNFCWRALLGEPIERLRDPRGVFGDGAEFSFRAFAPIFFGFDVLEAGPDALDARIEAGFARGVFTPMGDVWSWTFASLALGARGRHEAALRACRRAGLGAHRLLPQVETAVAYALAIAGSARRHRRNLGLRDRIGLNRLVRLHTKKARFGLAHSYLIPFVTGELACATGRAEAGLRHLASVAAAAEDRAVPSFAALAHHRRGLHLLAARRETEGERALREAMRLYGLWGASGAIADIERDLARLGS